jgi:hypothetical protein
MRRWAFVSVPVPDIKNRDNPAELVEEYVEIWKDDGNEDRYDEIAELWGIINEHRKIGPAIVEDIYEHVEKNPDYASAISMYVIPQLEGLREDEISGFVDSLEEADTEIDVDRVQSFVEDYFQIDLDR